MNLLEMTSMAECYVANWSDQKSILLSYSEVKCLEMTLYFLTEQLMAEQPHFAFTQLRDHHVRYLDYWLNQVNLKKQLRSDGSNYVQWPVDSREDLIWLALALEIGINDETIVSMAIDDANYERDMAMITAETDEDYCVIDAIFDRHYQEFKRDYVRIARFSQGLLAKFQKILSA